MLGIILIGAVLGAVTLIILKGRRREPRPVPVRVKSGRDGERR